MKRFFQPITWLTVTALVLVTVYELYNQNWSSLFLVGFTLILSIVPYVLQKKYGIYTPKFLQMGIVLFLFATVFLGEINQFYTQYHWWDFVLHGFAGAGVMLISFLLLVIIYRESELRSTPFMTALLAFSLTLMMAVWWEVYEFIIDITWKSYDPMQPSNTDTMTDFIATILGATVVGLPGYKYLCDRHTQSLVAEVIEEGKRKNS